MGLSGSEALSPQLDGLRGEAMRLPDEVAAMLRLRALGSETKRQDLAREHGLEVSLRTVERAVAHLRAEPVATVRFETPPGRQLQIDFRELRAPIDGESGRVYLFVATPDHSRRCYIQAFRHERQSAWLDGMEGAFAYFGGVPSQVLLDNARALVDHHDAATREVRFNQRLLAFARYWGFTPQACAPYRARTKGKDERGVGYVKRNAIAGHSFASWAALDAHLAWWLREIADVREHGTTGEPPLERFRHDDAAALKPLDGRPPFGPGFRFEAGHLAGASADRGDDVLPGRIGQAVKESRFQMSGLDGRRRLDWRWVTAGGARSP